MILIVVAASCMMYDCCGKMVEKKNCCSFCVSLVVLTVASKIFFWIRLGLFQELQCGGNNSTLR